MRKRIQENGITVNVIAGTYVVFFGLDLDINIKSGFRGFAIKRKDHSDGEDIWLRGLKTFSQTEAYPALGETFSSLKHPFQGFQWSDYSANQGSTYTYKIVAMYGEPSDLKEKYSVEFTIETEKETGGTHSVFFNRGSAATQEYARRFEQRKPKDAGRGAYEWLSRGLIEALMAFLKRAGPGDAIFGAVYEFQYGVKNEFQYGDVLAALKDARQRGADVKILFDDVESYDKEGKPEGPRTANRNAIENAGIEDLCKGRANAKLMHNKFFILRKGSVNKAVWTGSTNLTENGIFGHSNLGHIVEDETVADSFFKYWQRLDEDPTINDVYRQANMDASPIPASLPIGTTTIFSPRGSDLDTLNWYKKLAGEAKDSLFMTFAFGMHQNFKDVYSNSDQVLKMALMEKAYSNSKVKIRDEADIARIRALSNVVVALGNRIKTNSFDRWLAEIDRIIPQLHVYWIHTKYMLIDPLGPEPIVIGGSANFSKASTYTNDENMLIIKGDKRIADIYFGEYMRLFSHYSFRESVKRHQEWEKIHGPKEWKPQFLSTSDDWMDQYFDSTNDKTARCLRRTYFSGAMSE